ncbi:MAG TPA: type I glyceraldehyde-3-phosphate dehydrogenase [Cyclobacteriaceae bacterium]|nr:type I glyceraldehyde-3-phosphate dehydrogenase [Cyclobacteriaceae bacterium]
MKRIAINGFGRIGRAALKVMADESSLEVVAINDIMPIENAVYLLKYDSVYGRFKHDVKADGEYLVVGDKRIQYVSERDPASLPWKKLNVEVVIESTGLFTKREDAEKHIHAGAKTVVISAPTKSKDTPTVVHGVNQKDGNVSIFSCASCTTNNVAPVMEILDRRLGVQKAILSTVHAYTSSQTLVDSPSKRSPRMGRGGAVNLIPTSTGAAVATGKALPQLEGKFDGISIRTPVPVGSLSDITLVTAKKTTPEEVNAILLEESQTPRYSKVLLVSDEPLVSSDIIQSSYASIVDTGMTRVVDGDLVKVLVWYDNEWGFTNQMVREVLSL